MNTAGRIIIGATLATILVLSGVVGGILLGRVMSPDSLSATTIEQNDTIKEQLGEVQDLLDREALKPPNETSATVGAINGLLESTGDKYANYFDAQHFKYFNEETMGAFGGIGVSLGEKDGGAYVIEVFPDTPAEKVGLKAGDIFVAIDGVTREKWTSDEVVKRVRGEEGTEVKISMRREGEDKPLDFTLTREMIEYPNIDSKMYGKDVGYIRLGSFNAKSAEEIKAEIEKLTKDGAKAFVLDLRDNPGGLLDESVDVVSLFIPKGTVVKVEERDTEPVEYRATGSQATEAPVVVLVNENSASASEITAGALQDYGRAKLVGVKTFGKGSVQTVRELSSGGAVKFTTARYLTPKGRSLDENGLDPDIVVKMKIEDQADEATDTQLKKAIQTARDQL